MRRGFLSWKIESTTILLSTMLNRSGVLALADAWGYAFRWRASRTAGGPRAVRGVRPNPPHDGADPGEVPRLLVGYSAGLDARRPRSNSRWANRNPIEGASIDGPHGFRVRRSSRGRAGRRRVRRVGQSRGDHVRRPGADGLYTMYLPRLARWEGELAVDDLPRAWTRTLLSDFQQFHARGRPDRHGRRGCARDRAGGERVAATGPSGRARRRDRDLQAERRAVIDAVRRSASPRWRRSRRWPSGWSIARAIR
jgi:hypothetical protein